MRLGSRKPIKSRLLGDIALAGSSPSRKDGLVVEPGDHFYPLSVAAPGSMGRTGSWRTQRPVVDVEKCIGCYLCWLYCPDNTIIMREKAGPRGQDVASIDYEYCKGCGICANVCPVNAIEMVDESKFISQS